MKKKKEETLSGDQKVEKVLSEVHQVLNKHNLSIPEVIIFYGNLGYHLGAAIAGFHGKGPTIEELEKAYYLDPTVEVGLMLQGLLITTWEESFQQKPRLSNILKPTNKEEKKG